MIRVKVCGITRREDAEAAAACGASAVGFVFWPGSRRFVEPLRARDIVRQLPPFVAAVGVFVNQPVEHIDEVSRVVGLSLVQLHGDESPEFATQLARPIVKAVALPREVALIDRWPATTAFLVDADDPARRGGTGERADWDAAAALARVRRVVLAGGLNASNVREAVDRVRPHAVDVSSGVESAPGIKDRSLLNAFFEAIAQAQGVED